MEWAKVKAVFFDFDGVIVDSSRLKHDLFLKIVRSFAPEWERPLEKALVTDLAGAERSRVASWFCAVTKGKFSEGAFLERFAEGLAAEGAKLELVPGFRDFLSATRARNLPVAIISAAPADDIRLYLPTQGISPEIFRRVYGSESGKKADLAQSLLAELGLEASQVLYVGDMPSDLKIARELGMKFLRVESYGGSLCEWPSGSWQTFRNFDEISASRDTVRLTESSSRCY